MRKQAQAQVDFPVNQAYPAPEERAVSYGPKIPEAGVPEEMIMRPDRDEDQNDGYDKWPEEEEPRTSGKSL